jgi:hypothetical protein
MNAIALRFQNRRLSDRDPLANPEIDPIRPLNNLMWGYIQDDQHRLTLQRRSFEYDHHYGLRRRRRRSIAGADVLSGYGKHASAIVSFHLKEPLNEQTSKIISRIVTLRIIWHRILCVIWHNGSLFNRALWMNSHRCRNPHVRLHTSVRNNHPGSRNCSSTKQASARPAGYSSRPPADSR